MLSNNLEILNVEEKNSLIKILNTKYASYLEGRFFEIECGVDTDFAKVRILLRNSIDRFYYPVEARIAYKEENLSPKDAVLFLIDYADFYFDEFFKDEVMLTIDWSKHVFEDKKFEMKGQIFNMERERLADEWLKK